MQILGLFDSSILFVTKFLLLLIQIGCGHTVAPGPGWNNVKVAFKRWLGRIPTVPLCSVWAYCMTKDQIGLRGEKVTKQEEKNRCKKISRLRTFL